MERGPVELLCREIKFPFVRRMENRRIFMRYVSTLIAHIAHERHSHEAISKIIGLDARGNPMDAPSDNSVEAIRRAQEMVSDYSEDAKIAINNAAQLHMYCHDMNPEDAHPTDHYIDMVSSCASAVRFGLEIPCHSRHAAEATRHVWSKKYGIRLEDENTRDWWKTWACRQLQDAILSLALEQP